MARLEIKSVDPVDVTDMTFTVTLSKRNLLALLHKLEMEGSARTLTNDYIYLNGRDVGIAGVDALVLKCETDEEHYLGREAAGVMHPVTETYIGLYGGKDK